MYRLICVCFGCFLFMSLGACIDLESSDDSVEVIEDPNDEGNNEEPNDDPNDEPNDNDPDPVASDNYGKNTLNAQSPLAINIAPFAAWTPGWVLMDVFPKSQPWISNLCNSDVWGSGPALSLDNNGWVTSLQNNQCADTLIFGSMAAHYPEGTYVVLWEGDGDLSIRWDVQPEVAHTQGSAAQVSNGLNRMTFDITHAQQTDLGIGLRIAGQATDYIKNIRVIAPGGMCGRSETQLDYFKFCQTPRGGEGSCAVDETCYDFEDIYWDRFTQTADQMNNPKPVFHPLYASTYQQYRAIRFMKWLRPEDNHVENWSDRVPLHNQNFTDDERGFAIEYPLALANLLNADAYLNVPMMASDDYVTQYAQLVDDGLNANLKMYLEYGNEIFNPVTPLPYGYALDQANAAGSGIPSGDSDLIKIAKFAGRRSGQIFDIWDNQITDANERLIKVLVGFNPLSDYTLNVLDFENSASKADALAINGYIGPNRLYVDSVAAFDAMSVDDIIQEITLGNVVNSEASLIELNENYITHAAYANDRNLQLIAYEGGNFMQTTGAGQSVVDKFFTLNRDSRLADAFVSNFDNFEAAGATTFFYFLNEDFWTEEGAFGAMRYQDESREEAVIFDGLMNYIEATTCWWSDCERTLPVP
jgi:hypothetical protein